MDIGDRDRVFCSTIIPTIGRQTLARAVESVLVQAIDEDFEIIVVNDSGKPLALEEWRRSARVRVIATERQERSIARNAGAALATGRYLHFLDDDDALLPGALEAFRELSRQTDADWLYGGYRTVDDGGQLIEEIVPWVEGNVFAKLVARESIPLQASLIQRPAFVAAGGFDPAFVTTEDQHLGRTLALTGAVAFTPVVVAQIRIGRAGGSTNWSLYSRLDRLSFERFADDPASLARIESSAGLDAYWYGRLARVYLASFLRNLAQGVVPAAARRLPSILSFSGRRVASRDYWRGLRHVSRKRPRGAL